MAGTTGVDALHAKDSETASEFVDGPACAPIDFGYAGPPSLSLVLVLVFVDEPAEHRGLVGELSGIPADRAKCRDESGQSGRSSIRWQLKLDSSVWRYSGNGAMHPARPVRRWRAVYGEVEPPTCRGTGLGEFWLSSPSLGSPLPHAHVQRLPE